MNTQELILSRQDIIESPLKKARFVKLSVDLLVICEGDRPCAAVLDIIIDWTVIAANAWCIKTGNHDQMPGLDDLWLPENSINHIRDYAAGIFEARTIRKALADLSSRFSLLDKRMPKAGGSNQYRLNIPALKEAWKKLTPETLAEYQSPWMVDKLLGINSQPLAGDDAPPAKNDRGNTSTPGKKCHPPLAENAAHTEIYTETPSSTERKDLPPTPQGGAGGQGVDLSLVANSGDDLLAEFENEFWPLAYKKDSVGKARDAYIAARTGSKKKKKPPVAKQTILDAWRVANEKLFPEIDQAKKQEAERRGERYTPKQFIPMPATWLNQERWANEDVQALLSKQSPPAPASGSPAATEPEIRAEHRRLYEQESMIMAASGFRRFGVTTVTDLMRSPAEAADYLAWLRRQPTPQFDDYPMAM